MALSFVRRTSSCKSGVFQEQLEDLDFVDAVPGREIGGLRGELVFPDDLGDLGDEEFFQPFRSRRARVDFRLRDGAVELGLSWVREHPFHGVG